MRSVRGLSSKGQPPRCPSSSGLRNGLANDLRLMPSASRSQQTPLALCGFPLRKRRVSPIWWKKRLRERPRRSRAFASVWAPKPREIPRLKKLVTCRSLGGGFFSFAPRNARACLSSSQATS